MHILSLHILRAAALTLSLGLACNASMAGKPEWAGNGYGNNKGGDKNASKGDDRQQAQGGSGGVSVDIRIGGYFEDRQRNEAHAYYGKQRKAGRCPPGLAKKNNGCMPPGQAKKWGMGQPLPRDVVYYPVPNAVIVKIGLPPAGHRYIRVANDILLVTIGSMMVIDAIEDLMKL